MDLKDIIYIVDIQAQTNKEDPPRETALLRGFRGLNYFDFHQKPQTPKFLKFRWFLFF